METAATYQTDRPTPTTIRFTLSGPVVPKARARVTRNGTYLPRRYREWKEAAVNLLIIQARELELTATIHEGAAVSILLKGKYPKRGDLDNIAGAILDVLVDAGILLDDAVRVVSRLNVELRYDGRALPSVEIWINQGETIPQTFGKVDPEKVSEALLLSLATIRILELERNQYRDRLAIFEAALRK
jgi:Holliday junction resolvase RusA-like endonuclease